MEVALIQKPPFPLITVGGGFNPCFYGSGSNTAGCVPHDPRTREVSILVFMEVALIQHHNFHILFLLFCFNPCFYGSGSNTMKLFSLDYYNASFNPCFYGSGSNTIASCTAVFHASMFQSLFLWKWL